MPKKKQTGTAIPKSAQSCWAPCGQTRVKPSASWLKQRDAYKADSMKWVEQHASLMSFELWCVATGYKSGEKDHSGGAAFQQLMNYLLCFGYGPFNHKTTTLVSDYHIGGNPGTSWRTGEEQHSAQFAAMGSKEKALHSPVTQATHVVRGGGQGHWSGGPVGFTYPGPGNERDKSADYQANVARAPCSKLNWLQVVNTKQLQSKMATKKTASNSSEVQFATTGDTKNCMELEGCMATANITASLLGLYYYPGCDDAVNNWVVVQTVGDKKYMIRMRMWNPAYKMVDGKLIVQEPLNEKAKWPPKMGKTRVVGGYTEAAKEYGFSVPVVFQEKREAASLPLEPWLLIRATEDKTRLAPFFGKAKRGQSKGIFAQSSQFEELCQFLHGQWGDVVHEPDSGLYFGFNVPKAHWLYPNFTPHPAEIAAKGIEVDAKAHYGTGVQLWPRRKQTSETEEARTRAVPGS